MFTPNRLKFVASHNTKQASRHLRFILGAPFFLIVLLCSFFNQALTTPLNNYFDTHPIYSPLGTDKFYTERDSTEFRFVLTPFYQHSSSAKNYCGQKVPIGDRLGQWNMFGVFYGQGATTNPHTAIDAASAAIALLKSDDAYKPTANDRYTKQVGDIGTTDNRKNLTDELNFNPSSDTFAYLSVPLQYEKMGLRSQLALDFSFGLGVSIKAGVADYKQKPRKFLFEETLYKDVFNPAVPPQTDPLPPITSTSVPAAKQIYENLLAEGARGKIFKEIGLDVDEVRDVDLEDVHVQLYWHFPCDFDDEAGDLVVKFVPYLAAGAWIPVAEERNQDKAFDVSTGNDGFWGFTAEASLGFDFPKSVQVNLGGGLVVSLEKEVKNFRVPSSPYQSGFYPWKTSISKEPGITWYGNASFKAMDFIDTLSFFFDYVYTHHLKDSISLRTPAGIERQAFENVVDPANSTQYLADQIDQNKGAPRLERESEWRNQQFNFGMSYQVTENLAFGAAVQTHITGVRALRPTTALGSVTLAF